MSDAISFWLPLLGIGLPILIAVLILGLAPGWIAKGRGHPSWEAIRLCGLIGLLVWPCWLVALIWAHTGRANPPSREPDHHLPEPPRPQVLGRLPTAEEARAFEARSRRERTENASHKSL